MNENKQIKQEKVDWKKLEMGALWVKENASETRFSGKITLNGKEIKVVVFPNKYKDTETKPDFRIYVAPESYDSIKSLLIKVETSTPIVEIASKQPVAVKSVKVASKKVAPVQEEEVNNDF